MAAALVICAATFTWFPTSPALAQVSCPAGRTLNIVAHEDDDLLFLSPDLVADIQAGRCVRTLFATAGDAGLDELYWQGREAGAKAAYADMIGSGAWSETDAGIGGHPIPVFTHSGNPRVSVAFMRLPDGFDGDGTSAYGNESLQNLWESELTTIHPVDGTPGYSRSDVVTTLTALMTSYEPDQVRTQDHQGSFGDGDHSDHHATAKFAEVAHLAYSTMHTFTGYLGYRIRFYPANVTGANLTAKQNAFYAYGGHDVFACSSAAECAGSLYEQWLPRLYPVSTNTNLARTATATASSQDASTGQTADKANDGVLDGYPGDHTREWATVGGGAGSWLKLTWSTPQTISEILLYDRPNSADQITEGTLEFSDGGTVSLCNPDCALSNDGTAKVVSFPPRTTTSIQLTIGIVSPSTINIGLTEIEAYAVTGP
jgi:LmbE family N-acetylglucosaminyl deacetylase